MTAPDHLKPAGLQGGRHQEVAQDDDKVSPHADQHNEHAFLEDTEPEIHWRTWAVFLAISLLNFGINFSVSGTGFWLAYIIPRLGGSKVATWVPNAPLTVQVGLTACFGLIADFGPRTRKVLAVTLPVLGSAGLAIAGSAKSMNVLIVGTAFSGASYVSYLVQPSIASDIFPHRMRGLAQGYLYGIQAMGAVLAYMAGGALIENDSVNGWRWSFYIPVILQLFGVALVALFYQPIKKPKNPSDLTTLQRLKRLDWVGTVLFSGAFVPILMGLSWGGNTYAWSEAPVVATLVVGCSVLVALAVHQVFFVKNGVADHRLFKHRNFAISIFSIFVEGFVYITLNVYLGSHLNALFAPKPVVLGGHFAVVTACSGVSSAFFGYFSKVTRTVKGPLIAGFVMFFGAAIGFSQVKPTDEGARLAWGMCVLVGIGLGAPLALILTVGQLAVDPDLIALATGHVIGLRSFGALVGVSIVGAILPAKMRTLVPEEITKYAVGAGTPADAIPALLGALLDQTGMTPFPTNLSEAQLAAAQLGMRYGYARVYSYVYYVILPFVVVAGVAIACLSPVRDQMTWKIDETVEKSAVTEGDQRATV